MMANLERSVYCTVFFPLFQMAEVAAALSANAGEDNSYS